MHDQVPRLAAGVGIAQVLQREERRPGDELSVAQPGQQGDAPVDGGQPGAGAGGEDLADPGDPVV
jgi:hypothetical protein